MIIAFELERVVMDRIKIAGKVKELRVPVWFNMEYNTKTKVCIFVGAKSTVYEIAPVMVTAITA